MDLTSLWQATDDAAGKVTNRLWWVKMVSGGKQWMATIPRVGREHSMKQLATSSVRRIVLAVWLAAVVAAVPAADRKVPPRLRSRPPSLPWNRLVTDAFFDDAFDTLDGARPDFSSRPQQAAAGMLPGPAAGAEGVGLPGRSWFPERRSSTKSRTGQAVWRRASPRPRRLKGAATATVGLSSPPSPPCLA